MDDATRDVGPDAMTIRIRPETNMLPYILRHRRIDVVFDQRVVRCTVSFCCAVYLAVIAWVLL